MTDVKISDRKFGLMFALIFLVCGTWLLTRHVDQAPWFILVAILFLLAAIFKPASLGLLNKIWARLGEKLHQLVSPIILGAIYYLLFTSIGLARRLSGKDALKLNYEPQKQSYWETRTDRFYVDRFNDQF